jgi:hypothetical protein
MAIIYAKTDKGQLEIETRASRLAPRLRTALILVDGRRSDVELSPLIHGNPELILHSLLHDGFIEVVRIVEERAAPRPPEEARAVDPQVRAFELRRRAAVDDLLEQVGALGEAVAARLDRCTTTEELEPNLELARQILEYARGERAAAAYARRFIVALPRPAGA